MSNWSKVMCPTNLQNRFGNQWNFLLRQSLTRKKNGITRNFCLILPKLSAGKKAKCDTKCDWTEDQRGDVSAFVDGALALKYLQLSIFISRLSLRAMCCWRATFHLERNFFMPCPTQPFILRCLTQYKDTRHHCTYNRVCHFKNATNKTKHSHQHISASWSGPRSPFWNWINPWDFLLENGLAFNGLRG